MAHLRDCPHLPGARVVGLGVESKCEATVTAVTQSDLYVLSKNEIVSSFEPMPDALHQLRVDANELMEIRRDDWHTGTYERSDRFKSVTSLRRTTV